MFWFYVSLILGFISIICILYATSNSKSSLSNEILQEKRKNEQLREEQRQLTEKYRQLRNDYLREQQRSSFYKEDAAKYAQEHNYAIQENNALRRKIDRLEKLPPESAAAKELNNIQNVRRTIDSLSSLPYAKLPNDFKDSILSGRLNKAFETTDLSIHDNFNISCVMCSGDNLYETSLRGCSCPDFRSRHKPCKHMLYLSYLSGLMLFNKQEFSLFIRNSLRELHAEIDENRKAALNAKNSTVECVHKQKATEEFISNQKQELDLHAQKVNKECKEKQQEVEMLVAKLENELDQSYPWLAKMYKNFQIERDNHTAFLLSSRATTSKEIVKKLKAENATLKYKNALYENQLLVYESLFPWLEEFKTVPIDKAVEYVNAVDSDEEYDKISDYLSPAEYKTLSTAEKSQLALDRYKQHRKSDWEIGVDYERYVGYLYETTGYKVSYTGATESLKDMGRDLICTKGDETLVIQCKRWSIHKTIHEKHVFQLFGTTMQLRYTNPGADYKPILYTSTTLSDIAKYCAEQLGVDIKEQEKYIDYPCIKCNISKNGEKIYHLPFDQQYDRVSIEADKGELYVMTAAEAEEQGFRRAFRHNV